jgi:hypothetical protein
LPEKKHIKYLNKLTIFLQKYEHAQVPKRELESVIGTLSHITFVFQHGRSFMSNLYEFLTDFKNDYIPRYMRSSVISDLKWWHAILSYTHFPRSLIPPGPTRDYGIWVDASTEWGIGILWDGHWAAWRTADNWRGIKRDIGWLEGVAAEIAIIIAKEIGVCNADPDLQ